MSADSAARQRIGESGLHETLFVEAGAGTGKTHELVERVVNLVTEAHIPLSAIAAITFTEAAASELRDRIREKLERRLADNSGNLSSGERVDCEQALADIDQAAIGTLHGFCLRVLGEFPLEVGLPPRVEVKDEVQSQLAFEERWVRFVDELFADPTAEELILRAWALGVEIEPRSRFSSSFKDVAGKLEDSWDRLALVAAKPRSALPPIDFTPVLDAIAALEAVQRQCDEDGDSLLRYIVDDALPRARAALDTDDPLRRIANLRTIGSLKAGNLGAGGCWQDRAAARGAVTALASAIGQVKASATDAVLRQLTIRLAQATLAAAEARRAEGSLDFHDLLVLARRLLQRSAEARTALHDRYQRLLLDEFQDTDPIQIEVAVLIATAVTEGPLDDPWPELPVEPGRLFFVGDPKQSIYRFRRADIGLFLQARDAFTGDSPLSLQKSFRTVEPIVDWINAVFGGLMADEVAGSQAAYVPLQPARRQLGPALDHRVVLLGGPREGKAAVLRDLEADAVAAAISDVRDHPDEWLVQRGSGRWERPRLADITILIPTRTSLRQLEDALDSRDIPYRVATGTLVYDTQEIQDALAALQAIDDPGDALALVSVLRSPLYGCSDVELFDFSSAGGRWDLRLTPPEALSTDHTVVQAMAHLRSLWADRWWSEPSALLDRLLRERHAFPLAFSHRRRRDVWRRLRFVVDQARAFQESGGGGLRDFLGWTELQRTEGTRVHEPLLAETDDDAVNILTIHGAKGLEFPITVVSGATTEARSARTGVQVLWHDDEPEVKLRADLVTDRFDPLADIESEMDVFERRRLLYVACTRARDHLIVSTFHPTKSKASYGKWLSDASTPVEDELCRRLLDRAPIPAPAPSAVAAPLALDDRVAWVARREALLNAAAVPRFRSATAIASEAAAGSVPTSISDDPDASDAAVDGAQPHIPWRRGRAGTAIGRAVHATLQLLDDPSDDAALVELAHQHAHLEAVPDTADTIAALARSALRAPCVIAANAAERSWRELYVSAPLGDRAVEGYIDLLYEADGGLILVDYKTDAVKGPADVHAKVERYALQTAAYAVAVEESTGLSVSEARLVFCTTDEPIERAIPDLDSAKAKVRHLVLI